MSRRSRAREVALQLLFQYDVNPQVERADLAAFVRDRLSPGRRADDEIDLMKYSLALYDGVLAHIKTIDELIGATAFNWRVSRMNPVDRNALRLGVYQMLHAGAGNLPGPVAIDESVELAKRYGSSDSPGFVNGILDKIFKNYGAPSDGANIKKKKKAKPTRVEPARPSEHG
jgi:transcription antitermination protein NusB